MKLEPCPFCGNKEVEFESANDRYFMAEVRCDCGASLEYDEEPKTDKRLSWDKIKELEKKQVESVNRKTKYRWNKRS